MKLKEDFEFIGAVSFANELSHMFVEKRTGDLDKFLEQYELPEGEVDKIAAESTKMIESYMSIL
jgi:hypothetical protein